MANKLKISNLSEVKGLEDFWTIGVQNGQTVKYNLGVFHSQILALRNFCGIQDFNTSTSYSVNSYVVYQNKAYRFKKAHTPGPWNSTEVSEISAVSELKALLDMYDKELINITLTTDDPEQDLSGKIITIYTNDLQQYPGITDSNGLCSIIIPRDKYYTAILRELDGYRTSNKIESYSNNSSDNLSFSYSKLLSRTINITFTVSGEGSSIGDITGNISYTLSDGTTGTAAITNGSASIELIETASSRLTGTIVYPEITNYTTPESTSFTGEDTEIAIEYIHS